MSQTLHIPEDERLEEGIHAYLEQRLRRVKSEVFEICGRYNVSRVEETDARYRQGALDEAASWQDFQRLEPLEWERNQLHNS